MSDPRSHRRYKTLAAAYKAEHHGETCGLCPLPVDCTIAGPMRATIEHTLPIRVIIASTTNPAEALALACDTTLWRLAHSRCQSRQGQAATTVIRYGTPVRAPSRAW